MESPYKGKTGFRRLMNALHYSLDGIKEAHRNEDAFRQEVILAAICCRWRSCLIRRP